MAQAKALTSRDNSFPLRVGLVNVGGKFRRAAGVMEPRLFKYIWRHSWRDQLPILVVVVLAQVMYLVSLDLPKRIVNDAIQGNAFQVDSDAVVACKQAAAAQNAAPTQRHRATTPRQRRRCAPAVPCPPADQPLTKLDPTKSADFLKFTCPCRISSAGRSTLFDGFQLDQLYYLFALCFSYLFFVVLNGWLKQTVNTEKGRLGERMLRRLRFELFDRVLQFPCCNSAR